MSDMPQPNIDVIAQAHVELPSSADVTTIVVTLPPGSAGNPPHRHPGPVFGYLVQGEMRFEVEGEAERIICAGEAFWEPGGDLIHYQDANNLDDAETVFVVTAALPPGEELLTFVSDEELAQRAHLRGARPR